MPDVLRVNDASTRADIAESIVNVNARAKRIPHVVGNEKLPTEWDRRHGNINDLLTDWEAAT